MNSDPKYWYSAFSLTSLSILEEYCRQQETELPVYQPSYQQGCVLGYPVASHLWHSSNGWKTQANLLRYKEELNHRPCKQVRAVTTELKGVTATVPPLHDKGSVRDVQLL